jgi:hypothetical protein
MLLLKAPAGTARWRSPAILGWGAALLLLAMPCRPDTAPEDPPNPNGTGQPAPPSGWSRWLNPGTAPFIPIPEIGTDPESGTTLGVIPTWLKTDENHEITQIIAPDIIHTTYFGWGLHGRIYGYDSADQQWSLVAGIKERVEREFDGEFQRGRSRENLWSFTSSVIYNVNGTPEFYGIGNESPKYEETNYTAQEELGQFQVGLNFTHAWQLQYTARFQVVDVLPGTLAEIASIQTRFSRSLGIGTNKLQLNRLSVVFDTRDDLTVPTKGVEWVSYGGVASRNGVFTDSLYRETGTDARGFWPVAHDTVLAGHMALRYLPTTHDVPFWALSSLGGDESMIGGEQPLRGFGEGRFYDRDSFASSVEVRRRVWTVDAGATPVDVELAPFIDVGRVFARTSTLPFDYLHKVYGVGFRGIARPFVVGYVDVGYGSEGAAVFTGLNYPF